MEVKIPDLEYGNDSYADYLEWQMEEVVELINGRIFKKTCCRTEKDSPKGVWRVFSQNWQFF